MPDITAERPRQSLLARASNIALFAGIGAGHPRAEKKRADDDEDMKNRADDDGEDAKQDDAAPEDDPEGKKGKKGRKARKAEREDEDEDGEPGNDGDPDDEDDDEEEMKGKGEAGAARLRERARCAAILGHPAASANVEFACELAFNTRLGRKEAVALLQKAPKAQRNGGLAQRMADAPNFRTSGAAAPSLSGKAAVDASWDAAAERAGIRKPK